jgi:hypothetical protein
MTTRAALLATLCALVVAAAGCGDDDGPPSSRQTTTGGAAAEIPGTETAGATDAAPPDSGAEPAAAPAPEDKRGIALLCIRDEQGIDAHPVGDQGIQVGPGDDGPRIDFFQSSLEAEGEQFEGRAEGAQQIGAALLYVREAPEEQLVALEECLNEQ